MNTSITYKTGNAMNILQEDDATCLSNDKYIINILAFYNNRLISYNKTPREKWGEPMSSVEHPETN